MRHLLLAGLVSACTLAAQPKPGAGSIEGHVFNSLTSEPLRKATVTLTTAQMRQLVDDTDAEGKFRFTGLPPGTYKLSASRAGFLDHGARRPISLSSDEDVMDSEIRLPPQGVITGRILDEDNDPAPGTQVFVYKQAYRDGRQRWNIVAGAFANDAGEYRLAKLTPGRYIVSARPQLPPSHNRFGENPKAAYVPTYYPNASTQQAALPVEVGVGADIRDIDIHLFKRTMPPVFHVTGKVVGAPADSPLITVSSLGVDEFECYGGEAVARPPEYTFDLISRPGQCTIDASLQTLGPEAYVIYGRESVAVGGDVTGVVVTLAPPVRLSGRINMAKNGAQVKLQGLTVVLNGIASNAQAISTSDPTGKLVFGNPIRHGHYSMTLDSIPDGCFVQDVKLGEQEISLDDFELQGSAQMDILLSNTAGKIKGSISDADDRLVPASIVTLIPTDGKSRPVKQSADEKGNFQFASLRPGKYDLFAWEEVDDGLWQDPDFRKKYEKRSAEVTVNPSDTQNVQLRVILEDEMK
jgi:protocatechuate 3,4-dioxygenase beta subunit